jgi:hypothetical protein
MNILSPKAESVKMYAKINDFLENGFYDFDYIPPINGDITLNKTTWVESSPK